jgi:hypothetical protein
MKTLTLVFPESVTPGTVLPAFRLCGFTPTRWSGRSGIFRHRLPLTRLRIALALALSNTPGCLSRTDRSARPEVHGAGVGDGWEEPAYLRNRGNPACRS